MNETNIEETEVYGDERDDPPFYALYAPDLEPAPPPDNTLALIEPCTFSFLTGNSGSGKSTAIRRRVDAEVPEGKRDWGVLCSTTGVSAVSLGVTTINNLFSYFDTDSLRAIYAAGHNNLKDRLKVIAQKADRLILDEVSLFSADQLDIFYMAISELNEYDYMKGRPFGLMLTGDFLQLPPIKEKFAFQARCWFEFEKNMLRLTKVWRQDDLDFVNALNLIRVGDGVAGAVALEDAGVSFVSSLDMKFDGTTIVGKNDQVNRINAVRYQQLTGKEFELINHRWGAQRSEWRAEKGIIPNTLKLKIGALVMVLSNHPDFEYANGDLGEVVGQDGLSGVFVKLKRNDAIVSVSRVVRHVTSHVDDDQGLEHYNCLCEDKEDFEKLPRPKWGSPSFNCRDQSVASGAVDYWPLRLAYASTVHKVQSLSLDLIQVDARDAFVGNPGMSYVALSRCRTAEGLRIIGSPSLLAKRTTTDPRVLRFA